MVWHENGETLIDIEQIASEPDDCIALTVYTRKDCPIKVNGCGVQHLDPWTAREIAKTVRAWADTIEKKRGLCHDPFSSHVHIED